MKRIVFVTGTDARLAGYSLQHYDISHYQKLSIAELEKELKGDKRRQARINKMDKYADLIYTTNPDLKKYCQHAQSSAPTPNCSWRGTPVCSDYDKDEWSSPTPPQAAQKRGLM